MPLIKLSTSKVVTFNSITFDYSLMFKWFDIFKTNHYILTSNYNVKGNNSENTLKVRSKIGLLSNNTIDNINVFIISSASSC